MFKKKGSRSVDGKLGYVTLTAPSTALDPKK